MPGWRNGSIAYHMDDGKLYFRRGQGNRVGEKCGEGDVVGCGIELSEDGESIISVYWTRNGQLAGVFIFEAPPPASLATTTNGLVNSAGDAVKLGTDRGFTHLYYCGQRQNSARGATSRKYHAAPRGCGRMTSHFTILSLFREPSLLRSYLLARARVHCSSCARMLLSPPMATLYFIFQHIVSQASPVSMTLNLKVQGTQIFRLSAADVSDDILSQRCLI